FPALALGLPALEVLFAALLGEELLLLRIPLGTLLGSAGLAALLLRPRSRLGSGCGRRRRIGCRGGRLRCRLGGGFGFFRIGRTLGFSQYGLRNVLHDFGGNFAGGVSGGIHIG